MSDDNPRYAQNKDDGSNKDRNSRYDAEPLTVTIEPQTKTKYSYAAKQYRLDRAAYRLEKKSYRTAHWTMIFLIIYTGLTLIVAISSALATFFAKRSAGAAESAAATAATTLSASQQQFRSEQRPYLWGTVVVKSSGELVIHDPERAGGWITNVVTEVHNGGRSPAMHISAMHTIILAGPYPGIRKQAESTVPSYTPEAGEFIMPDSKIGTPNDGRKQQQVLTEEQVKLWVKGKWAIYALGGVTYRDIFKPEMAEPYETRYCFEILPSVNSPYGDCPFFTQIK